MDAEFIRWALMSAMGLVMWFGKRTIDTLERDVRALEVANVEIRSSYIHKDNFKEFKEELRSLLGEIKQDIKDIKFHAN